MKKHNGIQHRIEALGKAFLFVGIFYGIYWISGATAGLVLDLARRVFAEDYATILLGVSTSWIVKIYFFSLILVLLYFFVTQWSEGDAFVEGFTILLYWLALYALFLPVTLLLPINLLYLVGYTDHLLSDRWPDLAIVMKAGVIAALSVGGIMQLALMLPTYFLSGVASIYFSLVLRGCVWVVVLQVLIKAGLFFVGISPYPITVGGILGGATSLLLLPLLLAIGIVQFIVFYSDETPVAVCSAIVTVIDISPGDSFWEKLVFVCRLFWEVVRLPFVDPVLAWTIFGGEPHSSFWNSEITGTLNYATFFFWSVAGAACVLGHYW